MRLQNIAFELSLHLTAHKYYRFDDLIFKASALKNRVLEHKCEIKENAMVNKMESAMVGT